MKSGFFVVQKEITGKCPFKLKSVRENPANLQKMFHKSAHAYK